MTKGTSLKDVKLTTEEYFNYCKDIEEREDLDWTQKYMAILLYLNLHFHRGLTKREMNGLIWPVDRKFLRILLRADVIVTAKAITQQLREGKIISVEETGYAAAAFPELHEEYLALKATEKKEALDEDIAAFREAEERIADLDSLE